LSKALVRTASLDACQEKINSVKSAPVLFIKELNSVLNVQIFPAKLPNKDQSVSAIASIFQGKNNYSCGLTVKFFMS
jgi:hypothetical protein